MLEKRFLYNYITKYSHYSSVSSIFLEIPHHRHKSPLHEQLLIGALSMYHCNYKQRTNRWLLTYATHVNHCLLTKNNISNPQLNPRYLPGSNRNLSPVHEWSSDFLNPQRTCLLVPPPLQCCRWNSGPSSAERDYLSDNYLSVPPTTKKEQQRIDEEEEERQRCVQRWRHGRQIRDRPKETERLLSISVSPTLILFPGIICRVKL